MHALLSVLSIVMITLLMISPLESKENKGEPIGKYTGAKTATHPSWFKESFLDLEEDIADSAEQGKRLVVYFWQPGCPYCAQLWDDNFAQQDIVDTFRKNFEIIAINMWGNREVVSVGGNDYTEKSFAEALSVAYTPTLFFFDENLAAFRTGKLSSSSKWNTTSLGTSSFATGEDSEASGIRFEVWKADGNHRQKG